MYCYGVKFIRPGMFSSMSVYFESFEDAQEFSLYMVHSDNPVKVFLSDGEKMRFALDALFYIAGQDFREDW